MYRLLFLSLLMTSPALAATTVPNGTLPLDPLGNGCVDGGGYDDPFPASKGVRAPDFCIHDPCDRALSRLELSRDIIGRDVRDWEWDSYYSRYAQVCRADAVNLSTPSEPVTVASFYGPLIAAGTGGSLISEPSTGFANIPGRPSTSGGSLGGGSLTPTTPGKPGLPATLGGGQPGGGGGQPGGGGGQPGGGGGQPGGGGGEQPPVVPLPLPGLLLLGALASIVALRRSTVSAI